MANLEPNHTPQFSTDLSGKPTTVTLDVKTYISLLVGANVTDPELWPPGSQEGAAALARVRQIEADCIAQYAEFDWEKLTPDTQDEYDSLCILLDSLQDTGERISWEEFQAELEARDRAES